MHKIAVAGAGYVGLSIACLLASDNDVTLVDVEAAKVDLLNEGRSPIEDEDISFALSSGNLNLRATLDAHDAYSEADILVVAVPTNYDDERNEFDTSLVEDVLAAALKANPSICAVIKSTIPIGFTEEMAARYPSCRILFSPEFLREGKALYDNLFPSRIVVGYPRSGAAGEDDAQMFARLLSKAANSEAVPVLIMSSTEAEAVKLFANTYLALRVAFFNELDGYAELKELDSSSLIAGVTLDPRIGNVYCNPSFGYGGYCLPKDTKQLLAEFDGMPKVVIEAVVRANDERKAFVVERVKQRLRAEGKDKGVIGAYRLVMKKGSDNFRASAIQDVMQRLAEDGHTVLVYEPTLHKSQFGEYDVISDLDTFKKACDVILANRMDISLDDVSEKVYTRDCLKGY